MHVTETLNEGLRRALKVVVDAHELESDLSRKLSELSSRVRLKGFRPGKVPATHLRKVYGKSVMAEVLQKKVDDSAKQVIAERQLKPAYAPEIRLPEDQGEMDRVMAGQSDLAFTMSFEVVPAIELHDFSSLELVRLETEVTETDIDEALSRLVAQHKEFVPRPQDSAAEKGDRVTVSYTGTVDGETFEGGSADEVPLELGSGRFLPGFEEQLLGARAGEELTVLITFPADYGVEKLAGKPAEFRVRVQSIESARTAAGDDEFARKLGAASLAELRDILKARIASEYDRLSGLKLKRDVLDKLDGLYAFELPQRLVDAEFNAIWSTLTREMQAEGRTFADESTTEEEARKEYQAIAARRVRLGLVLGTVGEKAGISVNDEEMQRMLIERARQFPGQEKNVFDYYRRNPQALIELRGPLFEQKVIDHIAGQSRLTGKKVSRAELLAAAEDAGAVDHATSQAAAGHDHDHQHDHDHHHDHGHDHQHGRHDEE
jgi:trigger factor